ncbi:hypothetical protein QDD76_004948 [Burkholderia cepacia]|jgi:hypothetical protein|uniref:Integrase n=2 Tax=cellular organisms TaxID=131567 RepID=A0ABD7YG32_9BURK|nr:MULTISPECIES: hypothetical protein [Burkholderia]EKS9798955.1 hypothetical protein [Burkholderia cepacia]EKS9805909.1 hypothetical protein [Burkholderia cepacia]EKS9813457.1 hypothetical protein [Burkholderia cepacia]EKS9820296.1 hypothetical protein [Burkholderia cepacia]EKS9828161.1 hypothetical protein [Burkholderia cepacia]
MLIREQGRQVKLLRVQRSTETGRNRQLLIGAFRAGDEVPRALLELLSVEEHTSLNRWLAVYHASSELARARPTLASASAQLEGIVTAIDTAADTLTPAAADQLWAQLQGVAAALRRGGHPRLRRAPTVHAPQPGQRDLVDELAVVDSEFRTP